MKGMHTSILSIKPSLSCALVCSQTKPNNIRHICCTMKSIVLYWDKFISYQEVARVFYVFRLLQRGIYNQIV